MVPKFIQEVVLVSWTPNVPNIPVKTAPKQFV